MPARRRAGLRKGTHGVLFYVNGGGSGRRCTEEQPRAASNLNASKHQARDLQGRFEGESSVQNTTAVHARSMVRFKVCTLLAELA